jgi:hypothetical protein
MTLVIARRLAQSRSDKHSGGIEMSHDDQHKSKHHVKITVDKHKRPHPRDR